MRQLLAGLLVMFGFAIGASAQTPITPITVNPSSCGFTRGTGPLNCYSVGMTIGSNSGTAWVYPNWIFFRPNLEGANIVMASITSMTLIHDSVGLVTQETLTFEIATPSENGNSADPDNNGDADVVTGSITFNITYGPVGRYFMRTTTVSGSGAQSITQD